MRQKCILAILVMSGLFVWGCSCDTWTSFWGGSPAEKCEDHWHWQKEKPIEQVKEVAISPCAAAPVAKAAQAYPVGAGGNAIRLEKMAPAEIRVHEPFDYRIKVTNLTNRILNNVLVKDTFPANMNVRSSTPRADRTEGGEVHWMLGDLGPNASKMITVNATATGKGTIQSCGEVTYDSPTLPG